jgi:SARP family transcriptional regulator, regulator of embCAB operon
MAALAAVRAEPLRESSRAALIRVHIAEGNPSEALREFTRYGELLGLELGIEPTERLRGLVAKLLPVTARIALFTVLAKMMDAVIAFLDEASLPN